MVIVYTFREKIGKKIRSNIVEIYNSNDRRFTNDEVTKLGLHTRNIVLEKKQFLNVSD